MTVKKFLTLFLITWMFSLQGSLYSQQFDGGILAGGALSQVDGDYWTGFTKAGFLAGGFVSLELSPNSSLQLELEYIQKGSKKNDYYEQNAFHIPSPPSLP